MKRYKVTYCLDHQPEKEFVGFAYGDDADKLAELFLEKLQMTHTDVRIKEVIHLEEPPRSNYKYPLTPDQCFKP